MNWIQQHAKGISVFCLIQARASKTQIVGLHGEPSRLKIRVSSPPVDGEANEELIALFSKKLKIPKNRIQLVSGHTGKRKEFYFEGVSLEVGIAALIL